MAPIRSLHELDIEVAEEYARWRTKTGSIAVQGREPQPTVAREYLEALERVLSRQTPVVITWNGRVLTEDD